jgi:hypothetical protein
VRRLMLLLPSALLAACQQPATPVCPGLDELDLDLGDVLEAPDPDEPDFPPFALGVEYMQLGLEDTYAEAGAGWAKTRLEAFAWRVSEPKAPTGGESTYDWRCPDGQIAAWQQAGVTRIQAYLQPESVWGSRNITSDLRPKQAREDEYRAWVRTMIERYDGDGEDDMPGLVRPVRHWVIGGEWTGFWKPDDPATYLDVLEMTREEALAASDAVQIGAIPLLLIDVFEGNEPTGDQIAMRLASEASHRNSAIGVDAILGRDDLFDYINVHSLGDYTELPVTARWLRGEMESRGYDKPIWIDDAFAVSFLANQGWPSWHPVTDANHGAVYDVLDRVALGDDPEARAWIEAEVAKGVVHKAVTALGEGYVGINLGNTEDWMPLEPVDQRRSFVSLIGAAAMMGWTDVDPGTGQLGAIRTPGEERPALGAFELVQDKLGDGDFDVIEPLGELTGLRGYRFERDGVPMWVLWSEDGVLQLPGDDPEETGSLTLTVPEGIDRLCISQPPTARGAAPEPECVDLPGGQLQRDLTSIPVFIEPETP